MDTSTQKENDSREIVKRKQAERGVFSELI